MTYCETLPPDAFDLVIVDDCHRALYGQRRALLEYFDAPVVGFSATPTATVLGFFKGNLVNSYSYEQAVADGVAVDYSVYQIQVDATGSRVCHTCRRGRCAIPQLAPRPIRGSGRGAGLHRRAGPGKGCPV